MTDRLSLRVNKMNDSRLKKEIETYEARLQELLAVGEGKFVLIHESDVLGVWDTYADALKSGYETVGLNKPFLVRRIGGFDGGFDVFQSFMRELTPIG